MSHTSIFFYNFFYTYIETEVVLKASRKDVWEVFCDFDGWRSWTSGFMTFMKKPKKVGERCGVVCKLSQGAMKSSTHWPMVEVFKENTELLWRDFKLLVSPFWQGCHWFRFEDRPDGTTLMRHGTRQMGLAMPFLWNAMKSTELGYHEFNNELAAEVVRRFPATGLKPVATSKPAGVLPEETAAASPSRHNVLTRSMSSGKGRIGSGVTVAAEAVHQ